MTGPHPTPPPPDPQPADRHAADRMLAIHAARGRVVAGQDVLAERAERLALNGLAVYLLHRWPAARYLTLDAGDHEYDVFAAGLLDAALNPLDADLSAEDVRVLTAVLVSDRLGDHALVEQPGRAVYAWRLDLVALAAQGLPAGDLPAGDLSAGGAGVTDSALGSDDADDADDADDEVDARDVSAPAYDPTRALRECNDLWGSGAWADSNAVDDLAEVMEHLDRLLTQEEAS